MKRVLSLLIVLALVLAALPAVFAAGESAEDPIMIYDVEEPTEADVPAGATVYFSGRLYDVVMTIKDAAGATADFGGVTYYADADGVLTVVFPDADFMERWNPVTFSITNGSEEDATYVLTFDYPVGSQQNPAELDFGENTATLAANSDWGYYFTWTAPATGKVTITMVTEDNWFYTVSSSTVPYYGDMHYSDDDPVVTSESFEVGMNDEVQINVNTYDPNSWDTPAGEIVIDFQFEHDHNLEHHDAYPATCHEDGMLEHWYCPGCDCYFSDAEGQQNVPSKSLVIPAEYTLEHHEAVPATCHENGMQEYWYCAGCDCFFTDAEGKYNIGSKSLVIPAEYTLEHHEAVPATCHENGMQEYWYCAGCDCYFTDAEGKYNIASKSLVIPAEFTLEHHEEVPATATENGMKEYWYCPECDCYFIDAEGKYNVASKSLVIPATGADEPPKTGDGFDVALMGAVILVSGMSVVALTVSKKKFF